MPLTLLTTYDKWLAKGTWALDLAYLLSGQLSGWLTQNFAGGKLAKWLVKWLAKWLAWRENAPGIGNIKKNIYKSYIWVFTVWFGNSYWKLLKLHNAKSVKKQDNHTCQAKKAYTMK